MGAFPRNRLCVFSGVAALDRGGVRDYPVRKSQWGVTAIPARCFLFPAFFHSARRSLPMISRIVSCTIKPEKISEFRTALKSEVLPAITRQPGFVDLVESLDTESGTFVCTTLWNTRQDVERYDQTLFPELAQKLVPLLNGQPDIKTLTVENSTVHEISSGERTAA
jgi:quinol monooxygenase YgiN